MTARLGLAHLFKLADQEDNLSRLSILLSFLRDSRAVIAVFLVFRELDYKAQDSLNDCVFSLELPLNDLGLRFVMG